MTMSLPSIKVRPGMGRIPNTMRYGFWGPGRWQADTLPSYPTQTKQMPNYTHPLNTHTQSHPPGAQACHLWAGYECDQDRPSPCLWAGPANGETGKLYSWDLGGGAHHPA